MTTWRIDYQRTGRTATDSKDALKNHDYSSVYINTGDEYSLKWVSSNTGLHKKYGKAVVTDICTACECFEALAAEWGTYETRHAILRIEDVTYRPKH